MEKSASKSGVFTPQTPLRKVLLVSATFLCVVQKSIFPFYSSGRICCPPFKLVLMNGINDNGWYHFFLSLICLGLCFFGFKWLQEVNGTLSCIIVFPVMYSLLTALNFKARLLFIPWSDLQ